jgi:hypothetical protein
MTSKREAPPAVAASYIVRIYRLDKKRHGGVVGVVETVGKELKTAFTNLDELWNILKSPNDGKEAHIVDENRTEETH